jgi:hypothetical protein
MSALFTAIKRLYILMMTWQILKTKFHSIKGAVCAVQEKAYQFEQI